MTTNPQKIDGKKIAADINARTEEQVRALTRAPHLVIVRMGDDPVTESFLNIKQKVADTVGVKTTLETIPKNATQEEVPIRDDGCHKDTLSLTGCMHKLIQDKSVDSIVVQLPLPSHIDTDAVLNTLPAEEDPDVLGSDARQKQLVLAPVAGAVKEVLGRSDVSLKDKQILVVGQGRLVGAPVIQWLKSEGIEAVVADEYTEDLGALTQKADIIISGAGIPHLITADMVKEQAVLIDVGTSSDGGALKGDIHPDCYEKASFYTAVPGGIGPITVAKLFENIVTLHLLHIE